MRRYLPLGLLACLALALLGGRALREQLGIELSAESIQLWVSGLGWHAPVVFVALLIFRQFLFLPSLVILSAGGLCFGAALGTVLGFTGIVLSAVLQFAIARGIGREWLRPRFGVAMRVLEQRVQAAGPLLVGLATAHPTGPMGLFHWAAGFSTLSITTFLIAVVLAAPIRAFAYSFFGAALLEPGTAHFYAATAFLVGGALLPLVHTGLRRRLFGAGEATGEPARF